MSKGLSLMTSFSLFSHDSHSLGKSFPIEIIELFYVWKERRGVIVLSLVGEGSSKPFPTPAGVMRHIATQRVIASFLRCKHRTV